MFKVAQDSDAKYFLKKSKVLLYANEAEYSLMIGLAEILKSSAGNPPNPPIFLRCINEQSETTSALIQTRVDNCVVTSATEPELVAFADFYLIKKLPVDGVVGPVAAAQCLAKKLGSGTSRSAQLAMSSKILKLTEVIEPQSAKGELSLAGEKDISIVADWLSEFAAEAVPHDAGNAVRYRSIAEAKINNSEIFLWTIDGVARSVAHVGRPTKNGISVSAVYTPKEFRGQGYASNMVAQVSKRILGAGKEFCVLYTDATNPTSNKIYQNIGYEIIAESAYWILK
ncbi:MAG: GNAT family N-acetyltransferase [Bdellovibrionaceae bacterium]|nr:GNAT family N-acetyltransferase [Pseudobdellovibrionaceae bacterium]